MKKLLPLTISLFPVLAFSQGEVTLPFMENVYQSTYYNAANLPDYKVSIGLPGISSIYAGAVNSGFTIYKSTNDDAQFDIRKAIGQMQNSNYIYSGASVDLFHLRIRANTAYWAFDIGHEFHSYFDYNKDLFSLFIDSIPSGEKFKNYDLSNTGMQMSQFNRYAIGYTKTFKRWTIGARVKFLQGMNAVSTNTEDFLVQKTNPFSEITIQNGASVNISAPLDTNFKSTVSSGKEIIDYYANFKNKGFGMDLAISYQFRKKWTFSVAASNIGYIDWANNTQKFEINSNISYKGYDAIKAFLEKGSTSNYIDTLIKQVKPKHTADSSSFTTWLVPRLTISAKYDITHFWMLAATVMLEKYVVIRPSIILATQLKLGRYFSITGTGYYRYGQINFGAGVTLKPWVIPLLFYCVGDNLLNAYYVDKSENSIVKNIPLQTNSNAYNIRFGVNLVFGKVPDLKQQAFDYK